MKGLTDFQINEGLAFAYKNHSCLTRMIFLISKVYIQQGLKKESELLFLQFESYEFCF